MTQIEWTHMPGFKGETWNPVVGCQIVSKGCTNCYAMRQAARLLDGNAKTPHYAGTTKRVNGQAVWTGKIGIAGDAAFTAPLRAKAPRCYFVNSMGDLFAEGVPDEAIDRAFAVMALTPQHRYLILTKRPDRMRAYVESRLTGARNKFSPSDNASTIVGAVCAEIDPDPTINNPAHYKTYQRHGWHVWDETLSQPSQEMIFATWPLPNVWLGTSVEDQAAADTRIPDLLATSAAVRFISAEPLLGPVDLNRSIGGTLWIGGQRGCEGTHRGIGTPDCPREPHHHHDDRCGPGLDWVIAGGESGKGARPMHPDWARGLRDQCAAAGVPFFFKQWGEWLPTERGNDLGVPAEGYVHPHGKDARWPSPKGFGEHGPAALEDMGFAHMSRVGKKASGALLDDMEHRAFPVTEHGRAAA